MSGKIYFDIEYKRTMTISNAKKIREQVIRYGSREHSIPVKDVSIQSLIYRMDNGRTRVVQLEYLLDHPDLPIDFFKNNQENSLQQDIQHEFLVSAAKNPTKNIFKQLSNEPSQIDELLVTANGVVINGNRRLAAMRELLMIDSKKYSNFGTVTVCVLDSNVTEDDICEIEDVIQIKKDMKLEYGWIDTLITFKDRLARCNGDSIKINSLLKNWNINEKTKKENEDLLNLVDAVRTFGPSGKIDYSMLNNSEQNFKELLKINQKLTNSEDRQMIANINSLASVIIANSDTYGERSYSVIKKVEKIYDKLCEDKLNELDTNIQNHKLLPKDDSINFTGNDVTINEIHRLVHKEIKETDENIMTEKIKKIYKEVNEKEEEDSKKIQPRETLKEIHAKLCNIDWEKSDPELKEQVIQLLTNIEIKVCSIKNNFKE